jgi:hypothetical protein
MVKKTPGTIGVSGVQHEFDVVGAVLSTPVTCHQETVHEA